MLKHPRKKDFCSPPNGVIEVNRGPARVLV